MVLVDTSIPFSEYLQSLSKHAKKDYAYVQKHNQDLTYEPVPFVREQVSDFMQLWERQLIRGRNVTWAFPVEHLENLAARGELKLFGVHRNGEWIGLHFIQKRDGFWECHPPMYSKELFSKRYLAKLMWFRLIAFGSEHGLGILDLGGGPNNWHEHIKNRESYPNPKYKWIYIPEDVKNNPEKYPNYTIDEIHEQRVLRQID